MQQSSMKVIIQFSSIDYSCRSTHRRLSDQSLCKRVISPKSQKHKTKNCTDNIFGFLCQSLRCLSSISFQYNGILFVVLSTLINNIHETQQQCVFPKTMSQLLLTIHRPRCQQILLEWIFFAGEIVPMKTVHCVYKM